MTTDNLNVHAEDEITGGIYERPGETDDDLRQLERIAKRKATAFCNACTEKTANEQRVKFTFALVKYTRVIHCWLCKKF